MKILIDAGHGINTPGKRSPDGKLREYKYCREIAHEVVNRLSSEGYDVECIIDKKYDFIKGNDYVTNYTPEYDVSLSDRVKIINHFCNKLGAGNVVMVSIHCNAAGNGQWLNARGWSVWTTRGQNNSDKLATIMYEAAVKNCISNPRFRKDMSDGDVDWESNFYIIKGANCPCCLVENFFQDNKEDVEYLLSDTGREEIINTHIDGIKEWVRQHTDLTSGKTEHKCVLK